MNTKAKTLEPTNRHTDPESSDLSVFDGITTLFGLAPMRPLPKHKDPVLKAYLEFLKGTSTISTHHG